MSKLFLLLSLSLELVLSEVLVNIAGSTVDCNKSEPYILICNTTYGCDGIILTGPRDYPLNISCSAQNSCANANILTDFVSSLHITITASDAIRDTNIFTPAKDSPTYIYSNAEHGIISSFIYGQNGGGLIDITLDSNINMAQSVTISAIQNSMLIINVNNAQLTQGNIAPFKIICPNNGTNNCVFNCNSGSICSTIIKDNSVKITVPEGKNHLVLNCILDNCEYINVTCGNNWEHVINRQLNGPCFFNSSAPTMTPTLFPSLIPSKTPSNFPSINPSFLPTNFPSIIPTLNPSTFPSLNPSFFPTVLPTLLPSEIPTHNPSQNPTLFPSRGPSEDPSNTPTLFPSNIPSKTPSKYPSFLPSILPTQSPSNYPSMLPSQNPRVNPTNEPSIVPTISPTVTPTSKSNKNKSSFSTLTVIITSTSILLIIVTAGILYCTCKKKKQNTLETSPTTQHIQLSSPKSTSFKNNTQNIPLSSNESVTESNVKRSNFTPLGIHYENPTKGAPETKRQRSITFKKLCKVERQLTEELYSNNHQTNTTQVKDENTPQFGYNNSEGEKIELGDARDWTVDEVVIWLSNTMGYPQYSDIFTKNEIDGQVLFSLNDKILKEFGIQVYGHRYKIIEAIKQLE